MCMLGGGDKTNFGIDISENNLDTSKTDVIQKDYLIESAPYGFLFTSRITVETNE